MSVNENNYACEKAVMTSQISTASNHKQTKKHPNLYDLNAFSIPSNILLISRIHLDITSGNYCS